jgi:hypothetical protein
MPVKQTRRSFLSTAATVYFAKARSRAASQQSQLGEENLKAINQLDGTYYSAPPVAFDHVMGYRWRQGPIRVIRVIKGELIFDNTFSGNNYGYKCPYDFVPKKPSTRTFRFLALGDSFTNGLYMQTPWPQRLEQLLRSRSERWLNVEVYPIPIDGGGLVNWHSLFFNQILPDFEFDGLIIASWYENLGRKFIILDSDETGVFFHSCANEERPKSQVEFREIRSGMRKISEVICDVEIRQIVKRIKSASRPAKVTVDDYCQEWGISSAHIPSGSEFSSNSLSIPYSARHLAVSTPMLADIVDACRDRQVPVIFCAVPTRQGLLRIKRENCTLRHRAESEYLCKRFGMHYFDGYSIFDGISPEAIVDLYWLKYDGHWGVAASDLFALRLAEWITQEGIVPGPGSA